MEPIITSKDLLDKLSNIERKKQLQKVKLLKTLYHNGPSSTSEICDFLRISSPTSLTLINELIKENLLIKKGRGKSIGGRKPQLFHLKNGSFYILSIDIERFKVQMAILDNNHHNISSTKEFELNIDKNTNSVDAICDYAEGLIEESGLKSENILGIGVCMPGLIDAKAGENHTYLIPQQNNQTLKQILTERFKKPVYIENDVKSCAVAELKFGLANNKKDVLVLLMDWGIGLGIIMDGALRSGSTGYSGEFGHIPFVDDGDLCYCGKRGCLETVASGIALAKMAKEGIKSGQNSILNELSDKNIDKIEPHLVIDAANRGDQYAISILSGIGIGIGKGISTLIQLFNPELIILGGKMADAQQYITIPIQQSINTYCMTAIREKTEIVLSNLGTEARILGITSIAIDNLLDDQINLIAL